MRNVMLNATMLLLICSLTAQAAETREQIYRIGADVDAQGHITATVQPDGRLADMTVNSQFAEWPVSASFKDAALKIARTWHFIPEQVDGQPVATQVRIPMNFTLRDQILTPEQVKILREAARKEATVANAEAAQPGIPLPSEQEVALDSPLQPSAVATIISAP